MGLIKEYADRAVQTETEAVPSPYADPAVVLAAPLAKRQGLTQEAHNGQHDSTSTSLPIGSDRSYPVIRSPVSPVLAPLISRRLSKCKHLRYPGGEGTNRRVVSMPENKSETSSIPSQSHGKRVVSMPDRVRPVLEPSVELFQSPSIIGGDSFGPYSGRNERVCVFRTPSDGPQTPSPPSSPDSLLIIAAGTQLPEGFLRRKYSPEPLIEEDEDWITWTSSPPRPIPALHGPLSLPYARCPSGAEGTIIGEPDNVAQMIWGLGPDDQPHTQIRAAILSTDSDISQDAPFHGSGQVPPRLQRKRTPTQQAPKSSWTQTPVLTSRAKQTLPRTQRQAYDEKRRPQSHVSPDIEIHQDVVNGFSWNEGKSITTSVGVPESLVNDADVFPVNNNHILEWKLARLRQALRTSLVDMDSYSAYSGRLEPVFPPALAPGVPQSYPRIFVEPRPSESVSSAMRQAPIETAQHYRQQLYRQALQKQKLQVQNFLPTPPNSSSPQWSSHFSPYLTYSSTFSPELIGSTEHPVSVLSQKYRSGSNASQCLPYVYNQHEHDYVNNSETCTNISSAKIPQIVPNVNSAASFRQCSSSSSTLARYIKQLQTLSPVAHVSPLQPIRAPNVTLPSLPSAEESTASTLQGVYHSPAVSTPPSPESPQSLSKGFSHDARPMPPTCPMQRRLSSVPEEDGALLELLTPISSKLQNHVTTDNVSLTLDKTTRHQGHQTCYLEAPVVDATGKFVVSDLPELESNLGSPSVAFYHDVSPVKVRLPVTREHNIRNQASRRHDQDREGNQHAHRKKHRYKKFKGSAALNERAPTSGLAGQ